MEPRKIVQTTLGELILAVTDEVTASIGASSATYLVVSYILSDLLTRRHAATVRTRRTRN